VTTSSLPADPAALLSSLRADDIRRRLAEIAAEEKALRTLLRSVAARERAEAKAKEASRDHR
jgi:hypothetical protein